MTRDWRHHPLLVIGLLVVAALVWSALWLRISSQGGEPGVHHASASDRTPSSSGSMDGLPYTSLDYDPFEPLWTAATDEDDHLSDASDRVETPAPRITHRLQGVIGRTALLTDEDGSAVLVRAGDMIGSLEVLAVRSDHVEIRVAGQRIDLDLEGHFLSLSQIQH